VLSFGAQAEVLEPVPLRAAVAEAARRMTARYLIDMEKAPSTAPDAEPKALTV